MPERISRLREWYEVREKWAESERPARQAMRVFEAFYELWGWMERESERVELVLGDGVLRWREEQGQINHPILFQRVELQFDPSVPEFTVTEGDFGTELYAALFHSIGSPDSNTLRELQNELEQGGYHPLRESGTEGFLKSLVTRLAARGDYVSGPPPPPASSAPIIGRDPVIFLRARTSGFSQAIDRVLENLDGEGDIPPSLVNVVGVETARPLLDDADRESFLTEYEDPDDVLLSKEANREQIEIARRIEKEDSVLVQGPPGTGKSHTIANLIGHFLAEGKTVLVTSHATKALRVLRGHVVESLRPLCVSVLDTDLEGRQQLKEAVESIVRGLSTFNLISLEREAERLAEERSDLLEKLRDNHEKLRRTRAAEYEPISVAGHATSPSDAARQVALGEESHAWILGPLMAGAPLPLSDANLKALYETNSLLTCEDEEQLAERLPEFDKLPPLEELSEAVSRLQESNTHAFAEYWSESPSVDGAEDLEDLLGRLREAVAPLRDENGWEIAVIAAGVHGEDEILPWQKLTNVVSETSARASKAHETQLEYQPELPQDTPREDAREVLGEIVDHTSAGGTLGFWTRLRRPAWKRFADASRVRGRKPSRSVEFRALYQLVELQVARERLARRWDLQMGSLGAPTIKDLGERPEVKCVQYARQIETHLTWHQQTWSNIQTQLEDAGFRWSEFVETQPVRLESYSELVRIREAVEGPVAEAIRSRVKAVWCERARKYLNELCDSVRTYSGSLAAQLLQTVQDRDLDAYSRVHARLRELKEREPILERRRDLLKRLAQAAPGWARAVHEREDVHGDARLPHDAHKAWEWRQLHEELERRGALNERTLAQGREYHQKELRRVTAEMIDRLAWLGQLRRTGLRERQALMGWADTIRKIGRGTGKRAPRLRAVARQKMADARQAVPVWIMPLARVVENFDPRSTKFDVVIIDEASQSDVMGLVALYLGKRAIVVGDHEQVSPVAVGQKLDVVQQLIGTYLDAIPNGELYDGQTSVYDLAQQSFGGTIRLREHFRCVPDIIEFSNWLSYNGEIKPLRDPADGGLVPACVEYHVPAAFSSNKTNPKEALYVGALLIACSEQAAYRDKSFGVISLVGEEQAIEIEKLLLQHMSPEEHERRRIVCGNAAQFQGDERDVMFLSVVDGPHDGPLALRTRDIFQKRFNVAASRARDQMWVVHSLDTGIDLKADDLRRRLIEHVRDPNSVTRAVERAQARAQSPFEKDVIDRLMRARYRVRPQVSVGYYWIDIVVEGRDGRVAIECDGDRYHPIEQIPEDMARQAVLERLGWRFIRIGGRRFYRDKDGTMKEVFRQLAELDVEPVGLEVEVGRERDESGRDLLEQVIRRAHELLREWASPAVAP